MSLWTLPTIIASAVEKNQSLVYDYTEQATKVESVSYVQITDLAYGKETDTFDYTVLELFGDDQTGVLMNDLGNLPYLRYDDAPIFLFPPCPDDGSAGRRGSKHLHLPRR